MAVPTRVTSVTTIKYSQIELILGKKNLAFPPPCE